jgi:predicted O-methyltransferase YrrM
MLCAQSGTDKSPFTLNGGHRHPYTTPYSLLFEPMRNRPIKFAEIGIHRGSSIWAWRNYFSKAKIYGFELAAENVAFVRSANFPNTIIEQMDGSKKESLEEGFTRHTQDNELFDVILEDAAHDANHQSTVIRTVLPFIKSGGFLIIEDIFRDHPETLYEEALKDVEHLVSYSTFIVCDHQNRYSPGWNNDKLLVIVKK